MLKIIKKGKDIKHHNFYIHKCEECKTKFIYDYKEDTTINSITDTRNVIECPNCGNYDIVKDFFGISDKKAKSEDLIQAGLVEKIEEVK